MSEQERAARYEAAIKTLQPYIRPADDGSLELDIISGEDVGIDPVTFADLKRSLERMNRMIRNHEVDREIILNDMRR